MTYFTQRALLTADTPRTAVSCTPQRWGGGRCSKRVSTILEIFEEHGLTGRQASAG
jgi:hypothetical protein